MGIGKRIRDISVATFNERLEQAEDPVKFIDRYLQESREQIHSVQQLYEQCKKHTKGMQLQYLRAVELAEKREQQAKVALKAEEEGIARLALQEKVVNEEKALQYKELYEKSNQSLLEMEQQLQTLKSEYDEVLQKRQYYAARMESICLQQQMNERLRMIGSKETEGAFRRLEDRISDLECEGQSLYELRTMTKETNSRAGSTMKGILEYELEQLRNKLAKEEMRRS